MDSFLCSQVCHGLPNSCPRKSKSKQLKAMPASLVYVLCIMGRVWFMVECGRSVVWYGVVCCGISVVWWGTSVVRDELITGPYTGPARSISQYRPLATSLSSLNTSLPLEKMFGGNRENIKNIHRKIIFRPPCKC